MAKISNSMLINGQLRSESSGGQLELVEPATEQVWNDVPAAGKKEVDEALQAARKAFSQSRWSRLQVFRQVSSLTMQETVRSREIVGLRFCLLRF